jgi:hypothetical protein
VRDAELATSYNLSRKLISTNSHDPPDVQLTLQPCRKAVKSKLVTFEIAPLGDPEFALAEATANSSHNTPPDTIE